VRYTPALRLKPYSIAFSPPLSPLFTYISSKESVRILGLFSNSLSIVLEYCLAQEVSIGNVLERLNPLRLK
jgi:hypothetical protein